MPTNKMLGGVLDQAVKRSQHSIQHLRTQFVFDLDQTSYNINFQMFDEPTWVVKRIQHFIQHWFLACWMKFRMRLTRTLHFIYVLNFQGGQSTTNEMCINFITYYPKANLSLCMTVDLGVAMNFSKKYARPIRKFK